MLEFVSTSKGLIVDEVANPVAAPPEIEAAVDTAWKAARSRNPTLHDSPILSLASRDGHTLRAGFVPYRYWIAQRSQPALYETLQVRPLAVTALTRVAEGWILGRRAAETTQDPNLWELVPAGGMGPEARAPSGALSPETQLSAELVEELHVDAACARDVTPRALVHDTQEHVWDIVFAMRLAMAWDEVEASFAQRTTREVGDLCCVSPHDVGAFLECEGNAVAPVSRLILTSLA